MANIADKIAQIRQAIFGKDIRESIASGIEAINTEVETTVAAETTRQSNEAIRLENESGRVSDHSERMDEVDAIAAAYDAATKANLSVEVSNARGTFETLEGRLDDSDAETAAHRADSAKIDINACAPPSPLLPLVGDYDITTKVGTDNTSRMIALVNYAKNTGARIIVPNGKYRFTNQINIDGFIEIEGAGWGTDNNGVGTIFVIDFTPATAERLFYVTYNRCLIKGIEFYFPNHPEITIGWTPTTTPWAIEAYRAPYASLGGNHLRIENVMLRNLTHGIKIRSDAPTINGLYGMPFIVGLDISGCYDVARVSNVHFWWFWSQEAYVADYMNYNCEAIRSGRNDNPIFSNIFVFGAKVGIFFWWDDTVDPVGYTAHACLTNLGFDYVGYGIQATATAELDITNMYISCRLNYGDTSSGSRGMFCTGTSSKFNLTNITISSSDLGALYFSVEHSLINLTNAHIKKWNQINDSVIKFQAIWVDNVVGAGDNRMNLSNVWIDNSEANGAELLAGGHFSGLLNKNNDVVYSNKVLIGSLDATGSATVTHDIPQLITHILNINVYQHKADGHVSPITLDWISDTEIQLSGGEASRPYTIVLTYSYEAFSFIKNS